MTKLETSWKSGPPWLYYVVLSAGITSGSITAWVDPELLPVMLGLMIIALTGASIVKKTNPGTTWLAIALIVSACFRIALQALVAPIHVSTVLLAACSWGLVNVVLFGFLRRSFWDGMVAGICAWLVLF